MSWYMASGFFKDRRGTSAVEFALVAPILIAIFAAILVYGGWLWTAQSVQGLASEAARAALGGLDDDEREQLTRDFIGTAAPGTIGLDPEQLQVEVVSDAQAIRVNLVYDASDHPMMIMAGLIPSPSPIIQRSAVIRIGGY